MGLTFRRHTLSLPNTAYRGLEASPEVRLPVLINLMSRISKKDIRLAERLNAVTRRLRRAPKEVQLCCSTALLNGEYNSRTEWIPAADALAILTYHRDSFRYRGLVKAIREKTDISLVSDPRISWYEGQFGESLMETLGKISLETRTNHRFTHQRMLSDASGRSKRRIVVDFLVSIEEKQPNGEIKTRNIVIEFDEPAHEGRAYSESDEKRDKWLKRYLPMFELIRVKHSEQDAWLKCLESHQRLDTLNGYYAHCLKMASKVSSREERVITKESVAAAYDPSQNSCHPLLNRPKQHFREMKAILERLEIPFTGNGPLRFKRRKYGL